MVPAHPSFASLQPWLSEGIDALTLASLNVCAAACAVPPGSDTGALIHFVEPAAAVSAADYEMQILRAGAVSTRSGIRHDTFNALCWMAFPSFKRAANAEQVAQLDLARPAAGGSRGAARDALTLLDESGVIVLCADPSLASLLMERQWKTLFWENRAKVVRALEFFVCGHALYEKLLRPYPAITGRALIVEAPRALFDQGCEARRQFADGGAASRLRAGIAVSQTHPLPLAGIPGWYPGNEAGDFYDNPAVFRPLHAATAAGSSATPAQSPCAPAPVSSAEVPYP